MGIPAVPFFLDPGNANASFTLFLDHVDYVVDRLGIDRVGIGTDWESWTPEVPEPLREGIQAAFSTMGFREEHGIEVGVGFDTMQRYEDRSVIPEGLADRGYDETERAKLLGKNVLSFWDGSIRRLSAAETPREERAFVLEACHLIGATTSKRLASTSVPGRTRALLRSENLRFRFPQVFEQRRP